MLQQVDARADKNGTREAEDSEEDLKFLFGARRPSFATQHCHSHPGGRGWCSHDYIWISLQKLSCQAGRGHATRAVKVTSHKCPSTIHSSRGSTRSTRLGSPSRSDAPLGNCYAAAGMQRDCRWHVSSSSLVSARRSLPISRVAEPTRLLRLSSHWRRCSGATSLACCRPNLDVPVQHPAFGACDSS